MEENIESEIRTVKALILIALLTLVALLVIPKYFDKANSAKAIPTITLEK